MSETKTETKKEEEEEVIKIDPIPKGRGVNLRKEEFNDPKLRREIIRLREKDVSWDKIAKKIGEFFEVSISGMTVRNIYDEEIAKATIVSPKAKQTYSKYNDLIERNYKELQELTGWWIGMLKKLKEQVVAEEIMVDPGEFIKFLKITESIDKGNRSILEQLKFIRSETERVKIESKNYIYSPQQINQKIVEFRKVEQENVKAQREALEKERKDFEAEKAAWRARNIQQD